MSGRAALAAVLLAALPAGAVAHGVSKAYAVDVCAERDDPVACEHEAGRRYRLHHPWTPAMSRRAERDWEWFNRISARYCPDGTNDVDDDGPVCD